MEELNKIILDFLRDNIRKFFWGTLVLIVCWVLWDMGFKAESKTFIVGLAGFAMSQLKLNVPNGKGTKPDNTPQTPQSTGKVL